jgi:excisionase family DNA binding protein
MTLNDTERSEVIVDSQHPEWMTVDEIAAAMRVARRTVYLMIRRGELPTKRFGRLLRVHRSAVLPH